MNAWCIAMLAISLGALAIALGVAGWVIDDMEKFNDRD